MRFFNIALQNSKTNKELYIGAGANVDNIR
jgi:hypothetical protein